MARPLGKRPNLSLMKQCLSLSLHLCQKECPLRLKCIRQHYTRQRVCLGKLVSDSRQLTLYLWAGGAVIRLRGG